MQNCSSTPCFDPASLLFSLPPLACADIKLKISPQAVGNLYRDWVMPLTKDVELAYLLRRLEWAKL